MYHWRVGDLSHDVDCVMSNIFGMGALTECQRRSVALSAQDATCEVGVQDSAQCVELMY